MYQLLHLLLRINQIRVKMEKVSWNKIPSWKCSLNWPPAGDCGSCCRGVNVDPGTAQLVGCKYRLYIGSFIRGDSSLARGRGSMYDQWMPEVIYYSSLYWFHYRVDLLFYSAVSMLSTQYLLNQMIPECNVKFNWWSQTESQLRSCVHRHKNEVNRQ